MENGHEVPLGFVGNEIDGSRRSRGSLIRLEAGELLEPAFVRISLRMKINT